MRKRSYSYIGGHSIWPRRSTPEEGWEPATVRKKITSPRPAVGARKESVGAHSSDVKPLNTRTLKAKKKKAKKGAEEIFSFFTGPSGARPKGIRKKIFDTYAKECARRDCRREPWGPPPKLLLDVCKGDMDELCRTVAQSRVYKQTISEIMTGRTQPKRGSNKRLKKSILGLKRTSKHAAVSHQSAHE